MLAFRERRTCLCVQSQHRLSQQIVHRRLRFCRRIDDDDLAIVSNSFQGRNCRLIELVIYQLFHFLVQNYKKIIIF